MELVLFKQHGDALVIISYFSLVIKNIFRAFIYLFIYFFWRGEGEQGAGEQGSGSCF